jgi:hypothetical protein
MKAKSSVLACCKVFLFSVVMMLGYHGTAGCDEIKDPAKDYYSLVARLKSGDTSIDYAKLRYLFTRTSEYKPYGGDTVDREAMWMAMKSKEYEPAIKHCQAVLSKNYTDMEAHFVCNIAYREAGNTKQQSFHSAVLKGLIGSLYRSGNGESPETAFIVIGTDEEYFMLNMNDYKTIRQKLLVKLDMHFDEMEVEKEKTGVISKIYFNVEFPFRWLNEQRIKKN